MDTLNNVYEQTNKDLGFSKSHQVVLGYQYLFSPELRLKAEIYYQKLYDVPVIQYPSHISLINYGSSFDGQVYDSLVNGHSIIRMHYLLMVA